MKKIKYPTLTAVVMLIVVDGLAMLFFKPLDVGNVNFMLGLAAVVVAAFLIVKDGHLFTGWKRPGKKRTDLEQENLGPQVATKDVAQVKNQPIKVNRLARVLLAVGAILILLGIVLPEL
ncbi:DUF3899 domain-containing protein [Lentilactobacillus sp. Marseille-Q4993]|uniref:DUF3899 domain-containing protein n=1 Tax=Lentilactobacillus sp. Marseille-Q4993 TaxID=3039492 RepID=UPI0024BC7EC2|nr:DUF3899 domain-containing protein [Lentilactobacillus sp. Marseille-Q4993]